MTEYKDVVEYHRQLLLAEEWGKSVKAIHVHQLSSMWYDDRPQDTEEHSVTDTEYNDGLIERRLWSGELVWFGERLQGEELISKWSRHSE